MTVLVFAACQSMAIPPTNPPTHSSPPKPPIQTTSPKLQLLLAFGLDDASRMVNLMRRELASQAAAADPHGTFTTYAMDR